MQVITSPRAERDLLMAAVSVWRVPVASVRERRSDPAKSTRVS